jgi:hypothetical protein
MTGLGVGAIGRPGVTRLRDRPRSKVGSQSALSSQSADGCGQTLDRAVVHEGSGRHVEKIAEGRQIRDHDGETEPSRLVGGKTEALESAGHHDGGHIVEEV